LKRNSLNRRLLITIEQKLREKKSILKKSKELKQRKNLRSNDSENFRRELPIDKLKSTLSEQREPLKSLRDKRDSRRRRSRSTS
jgi:hypothetical protein